MNIRLECPCGARLEITAKEEDLGIVFNAEIPALTDVNWARAKSDNFIESHKQCLRTFGTSQP